MCRRHRISDGPKHSGSKGAVGSSRSAILWPQVYSWGWDNHCAEVAQREGSVCSPAPGELHPNFNFPHFMGSEVGMCRSEAINSKLNYRNSLWQTGCIVEYCFLVYSIADKDCVQGRVIDATIFTKQEHVGKFKNWLVGFKLLFRAECEHTDFWM